MKKNVYIIGAGPGETNELTRKAYKLINDCKEVYSFERIANLNANIRQDINVCTYKEIITKVNKTKADTIAVLVSGDSGFFSIAKTLISSLDNDCITHTVCGISSLQYFCSKIGISYENINIVSLHGRDRSILGNISYNKYVFVLTGGQNSASKVCNDLCENMLSDIKIYAGEFLSMENERIVEGKASEIAQLNLDDLTVLIVENKNYKDKNIPLFDDDFIRGKTPMTKEEIRWTSVNNLKISASDIVYDIGAGTGSVAIEMSRKANDSIVYAIEKDKDAFELLNKNRTKLGAFNVITILGEALDEIKKLPTPDKVFIGGSGGNINEIVKYIYNKNNKVTIVINAITLETLNSAIEVLKQLDFDTKIVCLNSAKSKTMGDYNLMIANNPVFIITGNKL